MTRIGLLLWAVLAGIPWLSPRARAAEPETSPAAIDAALREADRRFVAGDLPGALAILEPACSGSESPDCLFSLGAIHHGLGHCPEALDYYLRYGAVASQGEEMEEATSALEEVEARCGAAARALPMGSAAGAGAARDAAGPAEAAASSLPARLPEPGASPPPSVPSPPSLSSQLMLGSLAASGAAAAGSVVFGVLAAKAAHDCSRARSYDESFQLECEEHGPRYQGLWRGFALASASFLGIGMTLWWFDASSTASLGMSGAGGPMLNYRREF